MTFTAAADEGAAHKETGAESAAGLGFEQEYPRAVSARMSASFVFID
jgi:hypothetical protein